MKQEKSSSAESSPVIPHTPKRWVTALLLGVGIGLAVIIPGVSGSTLAILFGLYTGLLYAIGHIFQDFRRCFAFLLPIGIGVAVGFLAGFLIIQRYFDAYMFQIVCLFVGLMIGAMPALTRELKGERVTPLRGVFFGVGLLIPLAIGALSIVLTGDGAVSEGAFPDFSPVRFVLYVLLGAVVSATQIIPGLSATAILMAVGQFQPILNSLHADYILENPLTLGLYACLGVGFLGGMVLISRGFSSLLERFRGTTFFAVCGLAFGSVAAMFLNPDMWEIYSAWKSGAQSPVRPLVVGGVLLVLGFALSAWLTRYELKHGENE
ncbi:MAG: DUF368 domain-containing protein [Clostridia bacterium]|nr:DUF368 domain-containing protein [Clostridia bacterium]